MCLTMLVKCRQLSEIICKYIGMKQINILDTF